MATNDMQKYTIEFTLTYKTHFITEFVHIGHEFSSKIYLKKSKYPRFIKFEHFVKYDH